MEPLKVIAQVRGVLREHGPDSALGIENHSFPDEPDKVGVGLGFLLAKGEAVTVERGYRFQDPPTEEIERRPNAYRSVLTALKSGSATFAGISERVPFAQGLGVGLALGWLLHGGRVAYVDREDARASWELIPIPCGMPGCGGVVDLTTSVSLQVGCRAHDNAFPCEECGCLHWLASGEPAISRQGATAYWDWEREAAVLREAPVPAEGGGDQLRETMQFGSGATEAFERIVRANCQAYYEATGTPPEVVRTSEEGRFSDHIGEDVAVTLSDGTEITVRVIGGERGTDSHTLGLL